MIQPFRKLWFLLGLVVSNNGQTTERVWSHLPNNTGDLCPFVDVCVWKGRADASPKPGRVSCCTECSCEDSCGRDGNCCFPELDTYKLADRSLQSCTYDHTSVVEDDILSLFKSYYMVDKNPPGGCYINKYTTAGEECGNMKVAPWGTLYPAYSKQTGTIFRNMRCAECHGITDAELWTVIVNCNGKNNIYSPDILRFESNNCYVKFSYEKSSLGLKHEQCYINVIDFCNTLIIPAANNGLSKTELETACTGGLFSPYIRDGIYANVFCYLCNGRTFSFDCVEANGKSGRPSMKSLINGNMIEALQSPRKQKTACRKLTENERVPDCRPVHCPLGKIRIVDTCTFISNVVYQTTYAVVLRLVPADDTMLLNATAFEEIISDKKRGPRPDWVGMLWGEKWKIFIIDYSKTTSTNGSFVKEYFVSMFYEPNSVNPDSFFSEVQKNFDQQLEMGTGIVVNQTLTRYNIVVAGYITGGNTNGVITDQTFSAYARGQYRPNYRLTLISKMFFCEQIDLEQSEYVAYADFLLIHYKERDIFLYDGEFSVITDSISDNKTVRICLSDSGYVFAKNGAIAFVNMIFCVCVCALLAVRPIHI